ncbi:MAG: hypothetical protein RL417_2191 [Pseudomonadota bacterium]|jgi:hypothetical protein
MRSVLLILGLLVTLGVSSAVAQTSSQLTFSWGTDGSIDAKLTYNRRPARRCVMRLRAALSGERQTRLDKVGAVATRQGRGQRRLARVQKIRVTGLPGVGRFSTGDPVLTLQAQTTCRGSTITSNAVARFVKCGRNVPKVSASQFLDTLRARAR